MNTYDDCLFGENLNELSIITETMRQIAEVKGDTITLKICHDLEGAIDKFAYELCKYAADHDKRVDRARDYLISILQREVIEEIKETFDNL